MRVSSSNSPFNFKMREQTKMEAQDRNIDHIFDDYKKSRAVHAGDNPKDKQFTRKSDKTQGQLEVKQVDQTVVMDDEDELMNDKGYDT